MNEEDLVVEAIRRHATDGIPRCIRDGHVMKCDWELSSEMVEDRAMDETLEEHIASLMRAAEDGEQG